MKSRQVLFLEVFFAKSSCFLSSLEVTYDGIQVHLADIVQIVRKQNDFMLNMSATPSAVKPTMMALTESGLGLNPQQDGHMIYLKMPKVTTEHRQALIKSVKALAQKYKDSIKDRNMIKKFYIKHDKKVSQDLMADVQANVAYYLKTRATEIDDIVAKKVESLMTN